MKSFHLQTARIALGAAALVFGSACSSSSTSPVTTTGGDGGGGDSGGSLPTIAISSPTAGGSVALMPPQDNVSVAFAVTDFTLAAPGTCAGAADCGHIHVLVDGATCTPAMAPYNNDATSSPATAILSKCPTANGSHTATLELHHDDHSPFLGSDGNVISANVSFTASGG